MLIDYKTGSIPKRITEDGPSLQLWWMAWLMQNNAFPDMQHVPLKKVQWIHLSINQGFQCIESPVISDLQRLIQEHINVLEQYILGDIPYTPLDLANFTDGISRRATWAVVP